MAVCLLPVIALVVVMGIWEDDEMGKEAPRGRREIQVELRPWACPGLKGWALEL